MAQLRVIRQDDFTGGLNLRADQFQLAPNESPKMLNVEIDPRGGVFSRGAMRRINTSPVTANWKPKSLSQFSGTSNNYIMLGTGKSGATPGGVFYSTGSNFSNLLISVDSDSGPSFAPWGDTVYIAAGFTTSYKWNGTIKTALTSNGPVWQNSYTAPTGGYFPSAKHVVTHAGKVFVANTKEDGVEHPNRIRWSHPNSPENWAELDRIDINDGGSEIRAIVVYGGHLVVFKPEGVFAVFGYDSDTFQVVEISRTVGIPSSTAVVSTERGVYFFSYPGGLMLYNGERVIDLFEPIRPAIVNDDINADTINEVYVNYINRRVWVSVPYSETEDPTFPTAVFVYDPSVSQRGAWLMFSTADGRGVSGGCTFIQKDGTTQHVAAHPTTPSVLQVDNYTTPYDNISGTESYFVNTYRTRWMDAGSYSQKKMFRRPDVVVKQSDVVASLIMDIYSDYEESIKTKSYAVTIPLVTGGMVWGVSYWGQAKWGNNSVGSQIVNGRSIGLAKSIQIEFSGTPGTKWGINSFTLKYNPRKVTK
jgi:hypothetical protein